MEKLPLEAGLLDEPAGVDFESVVAVVNRVAFGFGGSGFGLGEVNILEERAGGRGGGWVGELVCADGRDDGTDGGGRIVGDVVCF